MKRDFFRPARQGLAVLTVTVLGAAAQAAGDDQGLDRLETWLASVQTLSGGFQQRLLSDSGQVVAESSGTMTLKRPGLFRWHYTVPSELLVVSDGKQVFSYDVELDNVTVMEQGDALRGSPAALLAGTGSVAAGFELVSGYRVEDADWFELRPTGGERDFRTVKLGLAGDRLVAMELHDQLGQITRVEFISVERNGVVDSDDFSFVVPAHVDVIRGMGTAP